MAKIAPKVEAAADRNANFLNALMENRNVVVNTMEVNSVRLADTKISEAISLSRVAQ